ncbi:TraB/GumN family protein [Phenylobacterium sp. LjRoot219]|uniref:TraB/GumN family protein n=1 Tax=Phenylobacterium sp. LjRoot219 TaxID=3342283 RepID=UPI003ECCEB61
MKSFRLNSVQSGLLALIAGLLAAGAAQARPPVWVVRDADSELVLFGSVHLLPPGLDWRPPPLAQAVQAADDVWFELPIDTASETETAQLAGQLGLLAPDQSLFKLVPPGDAERLMRVAKLYGVDLAVLDRLKPWLADVALSGAAYQKAGAGVQDGVEKAVAAQVPARAQRRAFETPREQVEILAGAPMAEQMASLSETLKQLESAPDEFAILVRAWMAGDLETLDREALEPVRRVTPTLFRRLVSDRNARWTLTLDERLKGQGRTVVVVGMGHLIGPDGVPARLRALGYAVEGP